MTESERSQLTFRQAEGLEPLPSPVRLGELSDEGRSLIWAAIYASLSSNVIQPRGLSSNYTRVGHTWSAILRLWRAKRLYLPIDEFDPLLKSNIATLKTAVYEWKYDYLFDFITFVLRADTPPLNLEEALAAAFHEARLAYMISASTIYPVASAEEGATISRAFADVDAQEYNGARMHLREAGGLISSGDYAGGIRESVNAVESVARFIEPRANTLADALRKLSAAQRINPNLKRGLESLYAYAGDEPGVRHALVFDAQPNVGQADAVYMFGACAAVVSFLIKKGAEVST